MKRRGVTLIELMVVVAVLGVLAAVAAPYFGDMMSRRRVEMASAELVTSLAHARSEASLRPTRRVLVLFKEAGQCYTMAYQGYGTDVCDCTASPGASCTGGWTELRTVQIPQRWGIKMKVDGDWAENGIDDSLKYQSPSLRVTPKDFTVLLEGPRGGRTKITVSPLGRASVCTPDGSISGFATCG